MVKPAALPSSKPKRTDVTRLLDQAAKNPNLTTRELGKLNGISHVAVINLFKRHGITRERVEEFKSHRADYMAGLQAMVLQTLTEDDVKKASIRDRTILFGTLYDKERLERGLSTQNTAVLMASAVLEADKLEGQHDVGSTTEASLQV